MTPGGDVRFANGFLPGPQPLESSSDSYPMLSSL